MNAHRISAPGLQTTAQMAALMAALCLTACSGDNRAPAPFEAAPAPQVYTPPTEAETSAKAKAVPVKPARHCAEPPSHIHGKTTYPCTGSPLCDVRSPEDGTLSIPLGGLEFLDPSIANETEGKLVLDELFEPLIVRPPMSGMPYEPGVAKTWSSSPDGRVWTFNLRDNALWSNGRRVVASDFVYAWRRTLAPDTGSRNAEVLWFVEGGEEYTTGKGKAEDVNVRAPDDNTLVVTLKNPTPFFLNLIVDPAWGPLPREAIEKHGKQWTRPEHMVSNGPYRLTGYTPRSTLDIERSETYWDRENISIPKVHMFFSDNEEMATRRYDLGQVQWQRFSLPTDKIPLYIREGRPDLIIDPYLCFYYYAFRLDKPPFDDVRVRRAINMAIDKETLVKQVTRGLQKPATGPMPDFYKQTFGYDPPEGDGFDPEQAKRLLGEAGFPNGQGLPPITLSYNTSDGHRLIAVSVQASLKETLGIDIVLENMEWKSLLKKVHSGDFQMARSAWCCIPDPWDHFIVFWSKSENNYSGYKNEEFDRLFEAALETTDQVKRAAIYRKAEIIIQTDMPVTPIYHYTRAFLKMPMLQGVFMDLQNNHGIRYLYWADKGEALHPATKRAEAWRDGKACADGSPL